MKDEYIELVEKQIEDWKVEIAKLKAKAGLYGDGAKVEYYEKMQAIERKQHETELKLQEIKEAGEESWEDITNGYEKIRREMDEYIKDAIASSV
jgi:hypothetical protein